MSKVYVKPKFAQAIDKAVNQNKSISDKPGKLDSSIKVLKKIGKAYNHSLPLGFQWLWLKHNVDLLTPYQVKYFNRKKGTSAWERKGSGEMADIKENKFKQKLTKLANELFDVVSEYDNIPEVEKFLNSMYTTETVPQEKRYLMETKKMLPKVKSSILKDSQLTIKKLEQKFKEFENEAKTFLRENTMKEARGSCWVGYKQVGMKDKGGRKVPNCVKEVTEIFYEENGEAHGYTLEYLRLPEDINEAEYQGRKVKLGKIMQGDAKKFKVYVKNPKGNVVKVNFGQGGDAKGGTMKIRKSNPKARKSFRARHNCDNPGPRHKARYWSCRKW